MKSIVNYMERAINGYKVLFEYYIKPLLHVDNLNLLFYYSYLIFIGIGLVLIVVGLINYKKKQRIKTNKKLMTKEAVHEAINSNKILRKVVNLLSEPLALANYKDKSTNDLYALVIIVIYGATSYFLITYINQFAFMWYTRIINLFVAVFLPYIVLHSYIGILRNLVANEVPEGISEFYSAYRNTKRVRVAIGEALPYMPKRIRREFKKLYSYMQSETTFDYGVDMFDKRLNHPSVTLLCEILRRARFKNSDISAQLQYLTLKARGKQYLKEKARKQLVWFRVFIVLWLLAIPGIMKFVSTVSYEAYQYYFSVQGATVLTSTIVVCIISYTSLLYLERT